MTTPVRSPLDALVRRVGGLYTIPAVAIEVLSLADDPRTDAARLKACIERDPALTTKLLRVVNSSLFGLARKVTDLNQAISLLGVKPLKLLVLSFSLPERLLTGGATDLLEHYWRRTLARAVAARELAAAARVGGGDEAFIAALLADLGVLVLLEEEGECYQPLYRLALSGEVDLPAAERKAFEFDHVQLTLRMLSEWSLPQPIIATIEQVYAAGAAAPPPTSSAAKLLHSAELLTRFVIDEQTELWPELQAEAQRNWRLSNEALTRLGASLDEKAAQLAGAMQLPVASADEGRRLMTRTHRLLCEQTERALTDWLAPQRGSTVAETSSSRGQSETQAVAVAVASTAPSLLAGLRSAAIECRASRLPLALCLVQIHAPPTSLGKFSEADRRCIDEALVAACRGVERNSQLFAGGDVRVALIWRGCDRVHALREVDALLRHVRAAWPEGTEELTLGAGVAVVNLPPRDFAVDEFVTAAERCLFATARAAADCVKSIELF